MKLCDFTLPELYYIRISCNFTRDEEIIFHLLSLGNTIEKTAELSNYSVSTVKRVQKKIWTKIERLEGL